MRQILCMRHFILLLLCAPAAVAQTTTQAIPLNYNYNGIVHSGENGDPDNPNGYRSISDRGLDFTGGVPSNPLFDKYQFVDQAGALDIIHLGCRPCTGWNGWDGSANGDCRGTEPTWLGGVNDHQSVRSDFAPITLVGESFFTFLLMVSDGGGSLTFTLHTNVGDVPVSGVGTGDWFGGPYPGTDNFDCGNPGAAGLNVAEITILDNGALAGVQATGISFSDPSNGNAGYAIFAANYTSVVPQSQTNIPLNYNYNGMVHDGESGDADNPNGYRSISDRGLNVTGGSPTGGAADKYSFVTDAFVPDIVHLGDRCNGPAGSFCYDTEANGDCRGIYPDWMPQGTQDQSGPQTTILDTPLNVYADSSVSVIFHVSDGGGGFDVTCGFASGNQITGFVSGGDWFGGPYAGTDNFDCAGLGGAGLHIDEGFVDIGAAAGDVLTSITFGNANNGNGGYAIFAANGVGVDEVAQCADNAFCFGDGSGTACPCSNAGAGCHGCANSASADGGYLETQGTASLSSDSVVLHSKGLVPGLPALFFSGENKINGGLGIVFGDGLRCVGFNAVRIEIGVSDANGELSSTAQISNANVAAGDSLNYQCWYREVSSGGLCGNSFNLTNAVSLTWDA